MKVTTTELERMRTLIAPLDTEELRAKYRAREIPRADAVQDFNKRYRFDLFYFAQARTALDEDADYADAHIETALRRIVPDL
jgi:hypothetical protein